MLFYISGVNPYLMSKSNQSSLMKDEHGNAALTALAIGAVIFFVAIMVGTMILTSVNGTVNWSAGGAFLPAAGLLGTSWVQFVSIGVIAVIIGAAVVIIFFLKGAL